MNFNYYNSAASVSVRGWRVSERVYGCGCMGACVRVCVYGCGCTGVCAHLHVIDVQQEVETGEGGGMYHDHDAVLS